MQAEEAVDSISQVDDPSIDPAIKSTPSLSTTDVLKLDYLGPIIINTDGTLQRIPNWIEMSEVEKSKALRLIAARNRKRIENLQQKQDDQIEEKAQDVNVNLYIEN